MVSLPGGLQGFPARMPLTVSQRKAIEHGGKNLQLIACAGSGKTEVVARRVVHLLDLRTQPVLAPRNIVAFTFTEKAAAELKDRSPIDYLLQVLRDRRLHQGVVLRGAARTFDISLISGRVFSTKG